MNLEKKINPYIDKQIELEQKYEERLSYVYAYLIGLLSYEVKLKGITRSRILQRAKMWRDSVRGKQVAKINTNHVNSIINLVDDTLTDAHVLHKSIIPLAHDLNIATDNLFNSIVGRFMLAIPAGSALAYFIANDEVVEELSHASYTSIARLAQNETSQEVVNLLVATAINAGYTEYLPDNRHDSRVRETHRIQNSGDIWYKFTAPPPSGLPGTEWGCRCFILGVR